ncbi:PAS domain-containing protein [Rhizobacter sp. Root1221]|uniref:PAS domain-containing protein n=1 Tax=Rhizobacter sp. Root1221 TaxID=1736433 RepID=UPI0006FDBE03|nr:PAS domain-containing protein [Rhizobacter sp. Root1221]KQV81246.1 hypothetical protein ASC87_09980 [Rhizobacter sp. Root1221]
MTDTTSTLASDSASDVTDRSDRRRPAVVRWLVTGNVAASVVMAALAGTALWSSHGAHEDRAAVAVRNLAGAMQQAIGAQVERVDLLLRTVAIDIDQARRGGASTDAVQRILMSRYGLLPELQVLQATDALGIVRQGVGMTGGRAVDLSDREYFIRARDNPSPDLVISDPVFGRTSQRWVVAFARRLRAADGSFDGIVYLSLPTHRLSEALSGLNLGREGVVSLRTADLGLITRSGGAGGPDTEMAAGRGEASPRLRAAVAASPEGGMFNARTPFDQVDRINVYLPVANGRLYVIAGLGVEEFMAPWRAQVKVVSGLAAAVMAVLAGASWLLVQAWQRETEGIAQLHLAARRNKALLRTASDGIHVLDRSGRLVDLSDSFATMLGYDREALLGRSVGDWEATLTPAQAVHWCADTMGRNDFKTRHRRADGSLIDVEVTSNTLRIDGEDLIYCSSRDVTERLQLTAEARQNLDRAQLSEQRVREVADNVPASIVYVDRNERLQFVNATFARMVGQPPEALAGRSLADVFGDAYQSRAAAVAMALSGHPASHTDAFQVDGRERHSESRLVPKFSTDGHVEGFYSLTHDLTERVELERLLSVQRRNLAAMTAVSSDVTVVLDGAGIILVANRAFEDHWGLAPGGAEGLPLERLYGPDFCDSIVRSKLDRVFAGETISLRTTHAREGERPRAFDVTYQPVRSEEGRVDAMVFTAHDVDDLVETVHRLQRTNESLQHFVRITSHDLREPLNTISQFVGLVESSHPDVLPPPVDRYFGFIGLGARRLRNMLDDLFRYVQLANEPVPEDEPVALGPLMAAQAALLAGQGHAAITIGPLPTVLGHGPLLEIVFRNLLSNGLKFTRPGEPPNVKVSAQVTGERVAVTVADEGIGIAEDDLPRVFEPFRRLNRRQAYDGTGLGLATCHRIVTAMGGEIQVFSRLGAWTRVTVTLRPARTGGENHA